MTKKDKKAKDAEVPTLAGELTRNVLTVSRRRVAKGGTIAPTDLVVVPTDTVLAITLTVDDPTIDPPTDAKVMLTVEASDDAGKTWYPVSSTWGGVSGVMSATIPVRGRRLRWHIRADEATTVDIAGSAV